MSALEKTPVFVYHNRLSDLLDKAGRVILGKPRELRLTLTTLLAASHLLIEDLPGMGKTTLVKLFARLLGLSFKRIQFTSDLLPADITGIYIYEEEQQRFSFHPGPVFSQLLLGDELNRASPKTQSACLQAMEEHEVTVDGTTHLLPRPFFFIGTQNPRQSIGTFPLPNSQLDRFMMRIQLGYPDPQAEKELLLGESRLVMMDKIESLLTAEEIVDIQAAVNQVHVSDALAAYVLRILTESRSSSNGTEPGLSPRAGIDLLQAAKAWAFIEGRDYVIPDDVQAVALSVMNHRLGGDEAGTDGWALAKEILENVPI